MPDAPYLYFCTEWIWIGRGSLQNIATEAKKMDVEKALIITDPGVHEAGVSAKVKGALEKGGIKVEIFSSVKPEPPLELANECAVLAKKEKVDLLVGLGGGSSMDTAKGASIVMTNGGSVADYFGMELTRKHGFPSFLIPTTAGTGAEVTRNAIFKDVKGKAKKVVVSRHTLPRAAIVDPELTVTTPPRPTAYTGIDALGHAIESYMSKNANPLSEMYSLKAIGLVHEYLPRAVKNGNDMEARENMALAALCGGVSLVAGAGGIAATSYPVEGHFNVPHGMGNGIMMPYIVEYNAPANIPKAKKIAERFGIRVQGMSDDMVVKNLVDEIFRLLKDVGLPAKLGEMGVKADAIPMLVNESFQLERLIKSNPAELTPKSIEEIYRKAM
jgi:alcohol dehydrogenase class IV